MARRARRSRHLHGWRDHHRDRCGSILGSANKDVITFGAAVSGDDFDLGAGRDRMILGDFTNDITVANVETITGGTGADTISFAAA